MEFKFISFLLPTLLLSVFVRGKCGDWVNGKFLRSVLCRHPSPRVRPDQGNEELNEGGFYGTPFKSDNTVSLKIMWWCLRTWESLFCKLGTLQKYHLWVSKLRQFCVQLSDDSIIWSCYNGVKIFIVSFWTAAGDSGCAWCFIAGSLL